MKKFILKTVALIVILMILAFGILFYSAYALVEDGKHNEFSKTKILLKFVPFKKADSLLLFLASVAGGNADMVKYFVEKRGFDVNTAIIYDDITLLGWVSAYSYSWGDGSDGRNSWLNEQLGIKNAEDYQNILVPRYLEIMGYLLSKGAAIDGIEVDGKIMSTPLTEALNFYNFERAKFLIGHGADVNKSSEKLELTPLSVAAMADNFEIVKYLVEHGAEINGIVPVEKHLTPLMRAAFNGNFEIVRFLVESGADVNAATEETAERGSITALTLTLRNGLEIMKYLVARGADINFVHPRTGDNYLMTAVFAGNPETVKYLVSQGLDVNAVNKEGKTALQLAEENGKTEIAAYLKSLK